MGGKRGEQCGERRKGVGIGKDTPGLEVFGRWGIWMD